MNNKEIKELQERCYAIGNSKFPLDQFFNDIRDNDSPRYNKEEAYNDLKLIVDEIYRLREKNKEQDPTLEEVKKEWEALGYEVLEDNLVLQFRKKYKTIAIYKHNKVYDCTRDNICRVNVITFQEHELITKTLKALLKEEK